MSKLSDLLNPATLAADDSASENIQDTPPIRPQSLHIPAHHAFDKHRHPPLSFPLDALATAATNTAFGPSPSPHPTHAPLTSEPEHRQTHSGSSSRPSSSHFQLPIPASLTRSPTSDRAPPPYPSALDRHNSPQSNYRRSSEMADGIPQELPPIRQPLHGGTKGPIPSIYSQTDGSLGEGLPTGTYATEQEQQQEMEPGRDVPMTSQIRQLSPGLDGGSSVEAVPLQPDVKTEVTDDPPVPTIPSSINEAALLPAPEDQVVTSTRMYNLKAEGSQRSSPTIASAGSPSMNAPEVSKPAKSKKRSAPKPKIEKKGTASAIKKPAAKKRKIDMDSAGGTPVSQRSGTPASSRASKTPAPRNRKQDSATPFHSSPAPNNTDDEQDLEEGTELFCICRKPDDHTWMIGCDGGCDDWFHGRCVGMDERDGKLIDKYICPNCKEKGVGQTLWKPMCRLGTCREPARVAGPKPSKYCCDEHGLQYMKIRAPGKDANREDLNKGTNAYKKRKRDNHTDNFGNDADSPPMRQSSQEEDDQSYLRGGVLSTSELKALVNGVKDVKDFRKLGDGVLSPPRTASPDEIRADARLEDSSVLQVQKENIVYTSEEKTRLAEIAGQKEELKRKRVVLNDKEKFLGLVRARAKTVLEELKKKEGIKDICGFDSRLIWADEEFNDWRNSSDGQKALSSGILDPPASAGDASANGEDETADAVDGQKDEFGKGVCQKKRCERHKMWFKLQQQDISFEKDAGRQEMRRLDGEEKGIGHRATVRYLESQGPKDEEMVEEAATGESAEAAAAEVI